jgi:hypothetical protein
MRKGFSLALLSLILHPTAFAYCKPLPRLICAEYSNSDAVVTATLLKKEHFSPPDKQDWFIYTLETTKVLKGNIEKKFRVYEENSSGRAPFIWKKGESYLLFLNPGGDDTWWIYGCGNSGPIRESDSILKVIGSLESRTGGLIQGLVRVGKFSAPMQHLTVEIRSVDKSYKTVTTREGKFKQRVQAGHYKVQVLRAGSSFKKDELDSYEDPVDVNIENGGCAEVVMIGGLKQ